MAKSDGGSTAEPRAPGTASPSNHTDEAAEQPGVNAPFSLTPYEEGWVIFQPLIEANGYMLRPRFRPGWVGSWVGTNKDPRECEDSIPALTGLTILDAVRIADGTQVMLKLWLGSKSTVVDELSIHQYLSSPPLADDPRNHTIPLIDCFPLGGPSREQLKDYHIMVQPLFRVWNEPPLRMVVEAVSFIKQLLEGLAFMHSHNVAHRDIHGVNVLMDARELIPDGFHGAFNYTEDRRNLETKGPIHTRIEVPVKYYYIDFGLSTRFPSFEDRGLVTLRGGQFTDFPELKADRAALYDPFPADIYALGWMLAGNFIGLRTGMDFTNDFFGAMLLDDPTTRPTAAECVTRFEELVSTLSSWQLLTPLRWRREKDWTEASGYVKQLWHSAISKQSL